MTEYVTKREMAETLSISVRTLDLWRRDYSLPTVKLGQVCRFDREAVLRWFTQFREGGEKSEKE